MKEIEIVAKTKNQPDVKGKCSQADTWTDCQKLAGGDKEAIEVFNSQWKTNALNKLRKPATGALALGKMIAAAKASGKLTDKAKNDLAAILKNAGVVIPEGAL